MKKIFIILGLVGLIHLTLGSKPSVGSSNYNDGIVKEKSSGLYAPIFTELDGNLFIAIKAKEDFAISKLIRKHGELPISKKEVTSSYRRINNGFIKTNLLFLFIVSLFYLRFSPERISKLYGDAR